MSVSRVPQQVANLTHPTHMAPISNKDVDIGVTDLEIGTSMHVGSGGYGHTPPLHCHTHTHTRARTHTLSAPRAHLACPARHTHTHTYTYPPPPIPPPPPLFHSLIRHPPLS